jgi:hypothetical protein
MILMLTTDEQPTAEFRLLKPKDVPVTRLELGDSNTLLVLCSDGQILAVRYLPISGLLGELRQQRLIPKLLELHARSPWAYLVVSGTVTPTSSGKTVVNGQDVTGWDWAAVQGALLSVQEMGVGLYTIKSESYLADTLYLLAKRDRTTKRVRPARDLLFLTPGEDVLLSLPGLGETKALDVLTWAGNSAARALDGICDPLMSVPGVSAADKVKIRKALGLAEGETLAICPADIHSFTWVPKESSNDDDRTSDTATNTAVSATA